jgi:hypothetical protein
MKSVLAVLRRIMDVTDKEVIDTNKFFMNYPIGKKVVLYMK